MSSSDLLTNDFRGHFFFFKKVYALEVAIFLPPLFKCSPLCSITFCECYKYGLESDVGFLVFRWEVAHGYRFLRGFRVATNPSDRRKQVARNGGQYPCTSTRLFCFDGDPCFEFG